VASRVLGYATPSRAMTKKSESSKTRSVEKTFLVPLGLHPKSLFSTGALLLYDQRVWVVLD
jgi:hypothetical protein